MAGPINLRAYTGLNGLPVDFRPAQILFEDRDPTARDWQNQFLLNMWLNTTTQDVWLLVKFTKATATTTNATWVKISTGGVGNIESLTSNSGGAVFPTADNINVVGDGTTITGVGNPGTSTITLSVIGGRGADSFPTNSGTATPSAGVLNVLGANLVTTTGSGNTVTAKLTNGANGQVPIGGGSNPLWANITSTGSTITVTNGANTINIDTAGSVARSFPTDSGTATPSSGVLNIISNNAAVFSGSSVLFSGSGNTVLLQVTDAANNTIIGKGSGNLTLSGSRNTGVGYQVLPAITTGIANTGVGYHALQAHTSGDNNTAIGHASMIVNLTSPANTGIGANSFQSLTSGSGFNVAVGVQALQQLLTGDNNCCIGSNAGDLYTGSESSNICLGSDGVPGDNNTIRIGSPGGGSAQQNKTFIAGIRGITTGVNNAIAVLIDSANQLGTISSSIRFKENVKDMGDYSAPLMNMRPVVFNFKEDASKSLQSGLIAEEVLQEMPDLVVFDDGDRPSSVQYHDLPALLLNELQKLHKRVLNLESRLK